MKKLGTDTLAMLHDGHLGISAVQSMPRIRVYWYNINKDILDFVQNCIRHQGSRRNEEKFPLFLWSLPSKSWTLLNIDFSGPLQNKMWLVVVDAYSRWLEANATTSRNRITTLLEKFHKPHIERNIGKEAFNQLKLNNPEAKEKIFCENDLVWVYNINGRGSSAGTIVRQIALI